MAAKKADSKVTIVGFIRQYLAQHPDAANGDVVAAGAKAGFSFDNQKVSQTKSDDKKKGLSTGVIRRGRAAKAPSKSAKVAAAGGGLKAEIEAIDRQITALQAKRKKLVDEIVDLAKWAAKS